MITQILGWCCTITVLYGFFLNANRKYRQALIIWIIGDIGWIWYDYTISNYSHATLSSIIILINLYGYWNLKSGIMKPKDIKRISEDLFL